MKYAKAHPPVLALVVLPLLVPACDGEGDGGDPCAGVSAFGGVATDETWAGLSDAMERGVEVSEVAQLSVPSEGEVFSAAGAPPTFAWSSSLAFVSPPPPGSSPSLTPSAPRFAPWWHRLSALFVGTAQAHGAPVTGDAYVLSIETAGQCPYRVITTELSWLVNDAAWSRMRQATGRTLSLELTSAYVSNNSVTEGPYRSAAPRTFSLAE